MLQIEIVVLGLHILAIEIDVPVRRRAELEVERLVLNEFVVMDLAVVERLLHAAGRDAVAELSPSGPCAPLGSVM